MSVTGGSGKEYDKHPDGTITVTRPDGTQSSISPGEPGYASTNTAMKDDTGSNKPTHNDWGASGNKDDSTQGDNRPSGSNIDVGSSSSSSSSSSGGSSGTSTSRPKQPAQYVDPDDPGEGSTSTYANIYDEDGNLVERVEVILKDGACYNKDTGQIMSDNHLNQNGGGTHNVVAWKKEWKNGESYWVPIPVQSNGTTGGGSSGGGGGGGGYYPPPPPPFIEFNEPMPTFKSELKKLNKFTYYFGIDDIQLRHVSLNPTCCFISRSIELGELSQDDYIELDARYSIDAYSSVEFYIIDGTNEIPIVPIKDKLIQNEKVFNGYPTRFKVDKTKPVIVKREGVTTNVTLEDALANNQNYVITYTPDGGYQYKPFHNAIKVKIIIRNERLENYAPCVMNGIKIRKYAKGGLWT